MSINQSFNYDAFNLGNMNMAEELKSLIGKYIIFDINTTNEGLCLVMGTLTKVVDSYDYDETVLSLTDKTLDSNHIIKAYLKDVEIERDAVLDEYIYDTIAVDLRYIDKYTVVEE